MNEPWFDPDVFGAWFGAIVGGGGGTLCGVLGALAGYALPRGKGRRIIPALMAVIAGLGVLMLAVGITALIAGQPYGIWYPLVLCGVIFGGVMGTLLISMRWAIQAAERHRMEAEDLRQI